LGYLRSKVEKPLFELLTPGERSAAMFVQDQGQGIEQEKIPIGQAHLILRATLCH
jgi:hypothetical protein